MAIRDARLERHRDNDEYQRCMRKANQHWDMAGLARQDRDTADAQRHTDLARDYERQAREAIA